MKCWIRFKAYHPGVACALRCVLFTYLVLVLMQMIVSWFQLIPLRQEFAAGQDKADCYAVMVEDEVVSDCGGFYDKIVAKRNALMSQNGCFHLMTWTVIDEEPQLFGLWVLGPVCYAPFPFKTVVRMSSGSIFD